MKKVGILCTVVCGLLLSAAFGADPVKLPPKEKFYLVLLAGQSNMAGRGKIQPEDRAPYPRVLMLNKEGNGFRPPLRSTSTRALPGSVPAMRSPNCLPGAIRRSRWG